MSEASTYPSVLDVFTDKEAKKDKASKADMNKVQNAIEAMQLEMGLDPAGSVVDLVTRLAVMMADSGALQQGTSDPGTPVQGQIFYRTDTDQVKVWDGASWDVLGGATIIKSKTSPSAVATTSNITLEPDKLYTVIAVLTQNTSSGIIDIRFNSLGTTVYEDMGHVFDSSPTLAAPIGSTSATGITIVGSVAAGNKAFITLEIDTHKVNGDSAFVIGNSISRGTSRYESLRFAGALDSDVTITDFEFVVSGGTMTGDIYLFEKILQV